jgi:type IV pilus assembly protein PilC
MDITANKMAENYDKEHRLNQKLRSATFYPIILMFMVIAVVLIIFTFVVPRFVEMFQDMVLPLPTRIVLAISDFLVAHGIVLVAVVVIAVLLLIALFRTPGPRKWLDRLKIRMPIVGKLLKTIYTARFARTLASLYVSGIPMIQAMVIARNTIGNKYIEGQFNTVIENLGNGRTLSQSIAEVDGFESKLKSTIMIGEESGRLEQMLESIADQYDYDSEMATGRLLALIEPVLIVLMAIIVGFVIISVMLPIYKMYSEVSNMGGE